MSPGREPRIQIHELERARGRLRQRGLLVPNRRPDVRRARSRGRRPAACRPRPRDGQAPRDLATKTAMARAKSRKRSSDRFGGRGARLSAAPGGGRLDRDPLRGQGQGAAPPRACRDRRFDDGGRYQAFLNGVKIGRPLDFYADVRRRPGISASRFLAGARDLHAPPRVRRARTPAATATPAPSNRSAFSSGGRGSPSSATTRTRTGGRTRRSTASYLETQYLNIEFPKLPPLSQGTSLRLATRPWLVTTGEYGGSDTRAMPGAPAAVEFNSGNTYRVSYFSFRFPSVIPA